MFSSLQGCSSHNKRKFDESSPQCNSIQSGVKKCADENTSPQFPTLTSKMKIVIDDVLNFGPKDEVVCQNLDTSLTRNDLRRLCGHQWLNDHIIDFYMSLIVKRSKQKNFPSAFAFTTFFYPKLLSGGHAAVERWTKKVDIFSYDLILVPVYKRKHWCLAVIDFRVKEIKYYDSVRGNNDACLLALKEYLKSESLAKKNVSFNVECWVFENVKSIPRQKNRSDCGVFILKYAEYICRNAVINFRQENVVHLKKCMVYELIIQELL